MARYLETARELQTQVDDLMDYLQSLESPEMDAPAVAVKLGHIVNLSVRCNPRQPQGTVRKNIVQTAMENWCNVSMTKEVAESGTYSYNKIHISAKD